MPLACRPGREKISTHRRSVPLARPVSPCKRCPPVPTSRMYADFTGTMISRRARREKNARTKDTWSARPPEIRTRSTAAPRDVQPLASSLTKMAAPANNRKQFPVSRAAAPRINSARHVYYYARDVIAAIRPVARARAEPAEPIRTCLDSALDWPLSLSVSLSR